MVTVPSPLQSPTQPLVADDLAPAGGTAKSGRSTPKGRASTAPLAATASTVINRAPTDLRSARMHRSAFARCQTYGASGRGSGMQYRVTHGAVAVMTPFRNGNSTHRGTVLIVPLERNIYPAGTAPLLAWLDGLMFRVPRRVSRASLPRRLTCGSVGN